jgi:sec-independent protein translocase protein TatC
MASWGSKLISSIREKGKSMQSEMSFFEHLEALRWHIIRTALFILVFAIVAFAYFKTIIFHDIILAPTRVDFWTYRMMCQMGNGLHSVFSFINPDDFCVHAFKFNLINTEMAGQFTLQLNTSIMIGLIMGIPYLLFELWRFIRPALHENERKAASGFVFYASFLFFLGVAFGYYIVTPLSVRFFATYNVSDTITNYFDVDNYISSITWLTLLAGIVFQLPMVAYILSSLTIVSAKFMRRTRRYATVLILMLAAIITPSPDALTMLVVAAPLFLLYEFSIVVASFVERRRAKREKAEELA